jgi:hypothetical protein
VPELRPTSRPSRRPTNRQTRETFLVEVRIGIAQSPKEIELDLGEVDRDKLMGDVEKVLADDDAVLWLTDKKGRTVGVPSARVSYVEIGSGAEERRVGFAR